MKSNEAEAVMMEGLNAALREATGRLYEVFTSAGLPIDDAEREHRFLKGVMKHRRDYERMVRLIAVEKTGSSDGRAIHA